MSMAIRATDRMFWEGPGWYHLANENGVWTWRKIDEAQVDDFESFTVEYYIENPLQEEPCVD